MEGLGDGPALAAVKEAIAEDGPVRFDEYMQLCLYHPDVGFYMRPDRGAGRRGRDFLTSPQIGPLFATVLGHAIDGWWDEFDQPDPFVVVDAGAGPGTLTDQLIAADLRCASAADFVMVDIAPTRPDVQRQLPDGPFSGVIIANELLDNLPFRIVESDGESWREVRVGEHGWVVAERVDTSLPNYPAGVRLPIQDAATAWLADALDRLERGLVVAIDYAADTGEMVRRPWLRTYREHRRGDDPLEAPGDQDITADVRIDAIPRPEELVSQAEFLSRHGIDALAAEAASTWRERAHLGDLRALRARSRVHEAAALTDADSLGGFSVIVARRA